MDFTSYAELAVRLVNTEGTGDGHDALTTVDGYRDLVADHPHLSTRATIADLDALGHLRSELRGIFAAAAAGDDQDMATRLNALLARHPLHPEITRHDGRAWHVHLADSGTVADRYAAGAVLGLTSVVTTLGTDRLGSCASASCDRVFIDPTPGHTRRYCSDSCIAKANVTAFRRRRGPDTGRASSAAG